MNDKGFLIRERDLKEDDHNLLHKKVVCLLRLQEKTRSKKKIMIRLKLRIN